MSNVTNYDSMTVAELEAANADIMAQRAALRAEQQHLVQVLDAKRAAEAVEADMAKLRERHGVDVQVVKPAGIESAEGVNG